MPATAPARPETASRLVMSSSSPRTFTRKHVPFTVTSAAAVCTVKRAPGSTLQNTSPPRCSMVSPSHRRCAPGSSTAMARLPTCTSRRASAVTSPVVFAARTCTTATAAAAIVVNITAPARARRRFVGLAGPRFSLRAVATTRSANPSLGSCGSQLCRSSGFMLRPLSPRLEGRPGARACAASPGTRASSPWPPGWRGRHQSRPS